MWVVRIGSRRLIFFFFGEKWAIHLWGRKLNCITVISDIHIPSNRRKVCQDPLFEPKLKFWGLLPFKTNNYCQNVLVFNEQSKLGVRWRHEEMWSLFDHWGSWLEEKLVQQTLWISNTTFETQRHSSSFCLENASMAFVDACLHLLVLYHNSDASMTFFQLFHTGPTTEILFLKN